MPLLLLHKAQHNNANSTLVKSAGGRNEELILSYKYPRALPVLALTPMPPTPQEGHGTYVHVPVYKQQAKPWRFGCCIYTAVCGVATNVKHTNTTCGEPVTPN